MSFESQTVVFQLFDFQLRKFKNFIIKKSYISTIACQFCVSAMFSLFLEFPARTRPLDLWPSFFSETGLKFLTWTQGEIDPGNRASPVNRAHVKRPLPHEPYYNFSKKTRVEVKSKSFGKWLSKSYESARTWARGINMFSEKTGLAASKPAAQRPKPK